MTTTDTIGKARAGGRDYVLFLNGATDGAETEIKCQDVSGSLESIGKFLKGKTLQELWLQSTDGSILATCILYNTDGGVLYSVVGNERTMLAATNIHITGLQIPLKDGMILKINTTD